MKRLGSLNVESEADLRNSTYMLPPTIHYTHLPGVDPKQVQAEATFKMLFDTKTQKLTPIGKKLCKDLKVPEETLIPRDKARFEEEYGDKEIGTMHYKHFVARRQKSLLRITQRLQERAIEHE